MKASMKTSRDPTRAAAAPAIALAASTLLAACGGGGGGDPAPAPPAAAYDVRAAFGNFYTKSQSWSTSGSDNATPPAQWTLVQTMAPLPDAAFPVTGEVLGSATSTSTLTRNGVLNSRASGRAYFRRADATLVGADSGSASGSCNVATAATPAPSSAAIGASGAYATVKILAGCSATSASNAGYTLNWSLENDGGVVLLCMNEAITAPSGNSTQNYCYETAPDGRLGARARVTIVDPQLTLTMRNF